MTKLLPHALFAALLCTACTESPTSECGTCPHDTTCIDGTCQPSPDNENTGNDTNNENTGNDTNNETPSNPDSAQRPCGHSQCTGNQLCLNQVCVERNAKAEADVECDPQKFLESCDGNQIVTCMAAEDGVYRTAVTDCEHLTCILHATKNLVNCNTPDPTCTAPRPMSYCYDMDAGLGSYLDHRECAMATDGQYYPFRLDGSSTDCEGGCRDTYSCGLSQETCDPDTYTESCDGDIAVTCDPTTRRIYGMNCRRYYNTGCLMSESKADCDWENIDYE